MGETPQQSILPNLRDGSARMSAFGWKTPLTGIRMKTPRTRRLIASAGPKTPCPGNRAYDYKDLLGKMWRAHALSPLYMFKSSPVLLRQYARSLNVAFSKGCCGVDGNSDETERTDCLFEVYHGLSFNSGDSDAIRIEVKQGQGVDRKVVLTALLVCVDIEDVMVGRLVDQPLAGQFTFYPLLMVSGTKTRAQVLLDWLQGHFDCRAAPMEFSNYDLNMMFAAGCQQDGEFKVQQVLLQYDIKDICEGNANTIDCKFNTSFCKDLWDRLEENQTSREFLDEKRVCRFVSSLETHLEYTMHIIFKKLTLNEIGTPLAYVSRDGKFKLFETTSVYILLHLICATITERFCLNFLPFSNPEETLLSP